MQIDFTEGTENTLFFFFPCKIVLLLRDVGMIIPSETAGNLLLLSLKKIGVFPLPALLRLMHCWIISNNSWVAS